MEETVAQLHIRLFDIEPVIWRKIEFPVTGSLKMLHDAIQAAMGWQDEHLWEFAVDDTRYGITDPEWPDDNLFVAKNIKLSSLIERDVKSLIYIYDFGDNWRHAIDIEQTGAGEAGQGYPRFVDGAQNTPPEDAGGTPGFEYFLESIGDPQHPEHDERLQWYEDSYGGSYDPDMVDEVAITRRLKAIAKKRAFGKQAAANLN